MAAPAKPSSLARILLRGTVWVTLGSYATQAIGFAAGLVLVRLLDKSIFGYLSLATFWFSLLNLRSKAGLNYAAIRQPATTGELLGTYFVLDAVLAVASFALSCVAALLLPLWNIPREVSLAILVLMGAESLQTLVNPLGIALERELQVSRLTLVSLVGLCAAYVVAIPLAFSGGGLWSLLVINIVSAIVSLGGIYLVARQRWPEAFRLTWRFDRPLAQVLLRQGLPTGLSLNALASIVMQFDNFLIGTFIGADVLGLYDRAYRIASWPNLLVTTIVSRISFLTFSKVQHDPSRLAQAVQLALWGLATLGLPLALGLFFGASDIIQVLYGNRWVDSVPFLRFLALYSLVWPFVSLCFWLAAALNHNRAALGLTLTQAVTIVGLGLPLTLRDGVTGTLIAVGVTMLVAFLLSNFYVFRQVPVSVRSVYWGPLAAGAVTFLLLLLAQQLPAWFSLAPIFRLVVIGIIIAGAFGLVLFLLEGRVLRERIRRVRELW